MKKHLLTLLAVLFSTLGLQAQTDWVEVTAGTVYTLGDDWSRWQQLWKITAEADGIAKIGPADDASRNQVGASFTVRTSEDMDSDPIQSYDYGPDETSFAVQAGNTYYITVSEPFSEVHVVITMPEAGAPQTPTINLVSVSPADGGQLSIGGDYIATITFDTPVTFDQGTLTIGTNETHIYKYDDYNDLVANGTFTYTESGSSGIVNYNGNLLTPVQGNAITIPSLTATGVGYVNVIKSWIDAGQAAEGDEAVITITGVKSTLTNEFYNGDGILTIRYTLAGLPTMLVSSNIPSLIKSWFNEGDSEALATFTFSRGISSCEVYLEMGQGDGADDLYEEKIDDERISINGGTITVDFAGKMRTLTTMGLKGNWTEFTIRLTNVIDEFGAPTFTEDQGSASTYTFTTQFKDITSKVEFEITPATGTTLTEEHTQVEFWVNNIDLIEWDGVSMSWYTLEETTEMVDDIEWQEIDGVLTPVVTGQHEETVSINQLHEQFIHKSDCRINIEADGSLAIVCDLPAAVRTANNVRVALNITASNDGVEHVVAAYYNTAVRYEWDIQAYADPVDGSEVDRLDEITLTMNSVYAINPSVAVTVVSKTGDEYTGTASIVRGGMTNATIVLTPAITTAGAYAILVGEGALGDYNYGESDFNSGTATTAFTLNYAVSGKYAGRDVVARPDDGETVSSLKEIELTYFNYHTVAPSWDVEHTPYVESVPTEGEERVTYGGAFEPKEEKDNKLKFVLDHAITTEGTYRFVVPSKATVNAANGDNITEEYVFTYIVSPVPAVTVGKPVVSPAPGEYDIIESLTITFDQPVYLKSEIDEWAWVVAPEFVDDNDDFNTVSGELTRVSDNEFQFNLYNPIKKAGSYTLSIPQYSFYTDPECTAMAGEDGQDWTYTGYNITGNAIVNINRPTTDPEENVQLTSLSTITLTFDEDVTLNTEWEFYEWNMPAITTMADYMTHECTTTQTSSNVITITLAEPITGDAGLCELSIPAGVLLNHAGKAYESEMKFTFIVGNYVAPEPGITGITPADGSVVEELQYFTLTTNGDVTVAGDGFLFPEIKNADGEVVATAWNGLEWNRMGTQINFEDPITEPGEYTLFIYASITTDWKNYTEKTYQFHYTIQGTSTSKFDPEKLYYLKTARGYLPNHENVRNFWGTVALPAAESESEAGKFQITGEDGDYKLFNADVQKYLIANGTNTANVYTEEADGTFSIIPAETLGGIAGKWVIKSNVTNKWMMYGGSYQFLNNDGWNQCDDGDQWEIVDSGLYVGVTDVTVDSHATTNTIYNLNGQAVTNTRRGLYIVDGKKVVIK